MRLLSFVPCGCRAGPIDDAPPASSDHAGGDAGAAARRRRRRRTAAAAALGAQWRPSLGDICELDEYSTTDAAAKDRRGAKVAPVRVGKASSWDVTPRAHGDEHRHLESASSMRGFTPTAFLF